jgi:hypothetical protein
MTSDVEKRIFTTFFIVKYPKGTATSRYLKSVIDKYNAINTDDFLPLNKEAEAAKLTAIQSYQECLNSALEFEAEHIEDDGIKWRMRDIELITGVIVDQQHREIIHEKIISELIDAGIVHGMAKEIIGLIADGLISNIQINY